VKAFIKGEKTSKAQYTVYEWLALFYKTNKIRRDGSKINPENENRIERIFKAWWEKMPFKKLNGLEIKERLVEFNNRPNTQRKLFVLPKEACENAVDNQIIKFNPCRGVKLERHVSEPYPVLQPTDHMRILNAMENPKYKVFFLYLCCTGLRLDAAVKSVNGIELQNNVVNVLKKDTATKKNGQRIPLLPNFFSEDDLILLKQVTANGADVFFKKLFKRLGIDAVIHSCRKTFASVAYYVGFRDKNIQM